MRTSKNYPLRIDSVKSSEFTGEIGMTLCPGKHQSDGVSGAWYRDLSMDLNAIKQWDTSILISL